MHQAIRKVTMSIDALHFNTAISALMEWLNALEKFDRVSDEETEMFIRLLTPLAPHLAEELWERSGGRGCVVDQSWPACDPALLVSDTMTIAVQVNGKLRGTVTLAADTSETDVIAAAKGEENVKKYVEQGIKKEIYVKGKLVSFVVATIPLSPGGEG